MNVTYKGRDYRRIRRGTWLTFAAMRWHKIKNPSFIKRLENKVTYAKQYTKRACHY